MYRLHNATDRRDKLFALLGMCADEFLGEERMPNYQAPWETLPGSVVRYLFGTQATVTIVTAKDMVIIRNKGTIIGQLTSVEDMVGADNRKLVLIAWSSMNSSKQTTSRWVVPATTVVEPGDWLCSIEGVQKPVILRLQGYYFLVIMSTTPDNFDAPRDLSLQNLNLQHDSLIVWNWRHTPEKTQQTLKKKFPITANTEARNRRRAKF
ncbi:uncharacterized protein PODANS_1_4700 [Podospora anserina S mat+]|uniref:Podospora anserina S mat+ genomic DNA chromosome 1, supercontig 1 n=1 Tax=Podospora anserina (strain S / ATCC MYA-4624 / DSM 980 / FGSC 10383) TaxID=515849 RepID=B2AAP2_PODAN|nr:uncharacterized protein PODANS_1_4700 [Podospora anserina S mat+]CAP60154.1 unnamed protein product [Podospora anserina S mat+]CDP22795.1 Putative protein of unknown function [Podospora anserina S mat+]